MNTTSPNHRPHPTHHRSTGLGSGSLHRRLAEGIHVLLVGSRPVMREGLGRCLRARGCQIVGEAPAGTDAMRLALSLRPHVVVVDVSASEQAPFELARQLTTADKRQRVLMVACHDDPATEGPIRDVLERAWECGVHRVVDSSATGDQLAIAVDEVRQGHRRRPPRRTSPERTTHPSSSVTEALTSRERQVLAHIAHGASTEETARSLVLSPATVKHHLSAAHRKLGARSRVEAVMVAMTRGLITVNPAEVNGRR